MINKKHLMAAVLAVLCLQANAQSVTFAKEYKATSNGNPISGCVFCADPTALEYNGRLYVYGTNDHQQYIKNNKKDGNGYGDIKSLVVFSTEDMVNWTFHGTIDVGKLCSTWGWRFAASWAPSVTWRTNENGEDEFFLYFANSGGSVGVLKASSPIGPWSSPLSKPMIDGDTPGVKPCSWVFDPGVVIDEEGNGWIAFGGGDPNSQGNDLQPNNACFAKLKPSMTALDGKPVKIPAPYHFEASELNIMNGKFVYTYCSSWKERKDDDWSAYTSEQHINMAKPGSCTMCYMVSDNPMDPSAWVYKGVYGEHPGFPSPNNHSHLHLFKGNYYYLYHWGALLKAMQDDNAVDSSADGYRSICVNKAMVNEVTQTISKVQQDLTGVEIIGGMSPYQWMQAETMSTSGGISYEDFSNIKKNGRISNLGNDASENMQVKMNVGAWTQLRKLDFGSTGASKITLRAKGEGCVEFRLGRKGAKPAVTFNVSSTDMSEYTVDVDPTQFKDKKTIYMVVTSGTLVYLDAWQAKEAPSDGIRELIFDGADGKSEKNILYDLNGHRLPDAHSHRGIVIEQYTDEKGVRSSRKRF